MVYVKNLMMHCAVGLFTTGSLFSMEELKKEASSVPVEACRTRKRQAAALSDQLYHNKTLVCMTRGGHHDVIITDANRDIEMQYRRKVYEISKSSEKMSTMTLSFIKLADHTPAELLQMAKNYYFGANGVVENQILAFELFQLLAADEHNVGVQAAACAYLGQMYNSGHAELAINKARAREYFELSADQDQNLEASCFAAVMLGIMYYDGVGVEPNAEAAIQFLRLGKEHPNGIIARARAYMGQVYYLGKGSVKKDIVRAFWYFDQAFKQNQDIFAKTRAAAYLGQMVCLGEIGDKKEQALNMFRWVTQQDDLKSKILAWLWLGEMHYKGIATKKNEKRALGYYKLAADQDLNMHIKKRAEAMIQCINTEKTPGVLWPSLIADL